MSEDPKPFINSKTTLGHIRGLAMMDAEELAKRHVASDDEHGTYAKAMATVLLGMAMGKITLLHKGAQSTDLDMECTARDLRRRMSKRIWEW